MKPYSFRPEAEKEFINALARSRNPLKFHRRVENAINHIAAGRVQYPLHGASKARECLLRPLPYSLIYVDRGNDIRIYALAHHKRRPGYWKSRLKKSRSHRIPHEAHHDAFVACRTGALRFREPRARAESRRLPAGHQPRNGAGSAIVRRPTH